MNTVWSSLLSNKNRFILFTLQQIQINSLCSPTKTDSFSLLSNKYKLILFALQQKLIYSLYSTNKNRLILPAEHVQVTIAVHLLFMKHMLILFPVYETHVNSPSCLWKTR